MTSTTKKAVGVIAGVVALVGTILYTTTNRTVQVPCEKHIYDTTHQTVKVKDSVKVSYKWYDTTYIRRYRRRSRMVITTHYADSLQYSFHDSTFNVIKDSTYMGLCDSTITDTIPNEPDKAKYGVLVNDAILTTAQKVQLAQLYGVKYIRTEVRLKDYDGIADNIQKYHDAGFKIIVNLNWDINQGTPRKFVSDTVALASKLDLVFSKYGSMIETAVIENEVLTQTYFNDDMKNYITELRVAIREGKKYGINVTNSGDHLEFIPYIYDGQKTTTDRVANCKYLMEHYKGMGMTVINTHTGQLFSDVSTNDVQIKKIADYIRVTTGVNEIISNETVLQENTSAYVDKIVHLYNVVNFTKVIIFDGEGSGALGAQSLHVTGRVMISTLGNIVISSINSVTSQVN